MLLNSYNFESPILSALILLGDKDDDGLLNIWESRGIDYNGDGEIDLDLPSLGANPNHRDIFLEIDYMENHKPYPAAIDVIKRAFSEAPLSNPDGYMGINLHVFVDEKIPEREGLTVDEFYRIKHNYSGYSLERNDTNYHNINNAKLDVFHYGLFAHTQIPNATSSGYSPRTPGMEFIITLGYPGWEVDYQTNHTVGSVDQQAGTLMHELGHNLGLHHGGADNTDKKPNYLSVMNKNFQFADNVADRPYDYSRLPQRSINENSLYEPFGIGLTSPPGLMTFISCPPHEASTYEVLTGIAVDYNGNNNFTDGDLSGHSPFYLDLNCDDEYETLVGQNDWASLIYISPSNYPGRVPLSNDNSNMSIMRSVVPYNVTINYPADERSIIDVHNDKIAKSIGTLNGIENVIRFLSTTNITSYGSENRSLVNVPELNSLNRTITTILDKGPMNGTDSVVNNLTMIKSQLQSTILDLPTSTQQLAILNTIPRIDNLIQVLEYDG